MERLKMMSGEVECDRAGILDTDEEDEDVHRIGGLRSPDNRDVPDANRVR